MTGVSRHGELYTSRATSRGWSSRTANHNAVRFEISAGNAGSGTWPGAAAVWRLPGDVPTALIGAPHARVEAPRDVEVVRAIGDDGSEAVSHRLSRPLGHSRKHARAVQSGCPTMARRTGLVTVIRPPRSPAGCGGTLFIAAAAGTSQIWQPCLRSLAGRCIPRCCIAAGLTRAASIDFVCSGIDLPCHQ